MLGGSRIVLSRLTVLATVPCNPISGIDDSTENYQVHSRSTVALRAPRVSATLLLDVLLSQSWVQRPSLDPPMYLY